MVTDPIVTANIAILTFTKPQAPEGLPHATVGSVDIADGSGLPCGTLLIGEREFAWEVGYLDGPHLIENPSDRGSMIEYADWTYFLQTVLDRNIDTRTARDFGDYMIDMIGYAASHVHSAMAQAVGQAAGTILAVANA